MIHARHPKASDKLARYAVPFMTYKTTLLGRVLMTPGLNETHGFPDSALVDQSRGLSHQLGPKRNPYKPLHLQAEAGHEVRRAGAKARACA
jgi:hypothetical protein